MRHQSAPPLGGVLAAEVVEALPDITAVVDASGTIITVNRAWRMFALDNGGRPETTGVGVNYLDVCERAAAAGCPEAADVVTGLEAVLTGQTTERDREYPCPSPEVARWFNSRIVPLSGATRGAVVSHINISRRKASERQLEYRASHDPLTGLANRLLFTDRLKEALCHRPDRSHLGFKGSLQHLVREVVDDGTGQSSEGSPCIERTDPVSGGSVDRSAREPIGERTG